MITRTYVIVLLAALVSVSSAFAKGPTVQISIAGPDLSAPIHTTDPVAIAASVWGGGYADWETGPVEEPPSTLPRYSCHFWVQLGENNIQMKYVILYVWDPKNDKAFVYVPGQDDLWYRNNVYTIYLPDRQGNWFPASPDWGESIRLILANATGA